MSKPYEILEPSLPLSNFTFVKRPTGDLLVAEASDLQDFRIRQLYDDACDVGVVVKSHHTGRTVAFCLTHEEKHDGDLVAWHFVSVGLGDRDLRMVVFND